MKDANSYIVEMNRSTGKVWKLHTTDVKQAVGKVKKHITDDDVISITIRVNTTRPDE